MTHGSRIAVPGMTRVEGEGGLDLVVHGDRVTEARLDIYEPPRFFEALLRGRAYTEPPDITARICGICPVAYQMSSCQAIEDACGTVISPQIAALRRLLYCGEWIESHALHIYLLHAPDFVRVPGDHSPGRQSMGYPSGIDMARDHPDLVARGLRLKKTGNALMTVVGGRPVHPVNVRVGGFYRAPAIANLKGLLPELDWARTAARDTIDWVSSFSFPDFTRYGEFVTLRHPTAYPITDGRIASSGGLDIPVAEYDAHFTEFQVPHSTALHSVLEGSRTYLTGPMARYNLNHDRLPRELTSALGRICRNPFESIIVRAIEMAYAMDEAIAIIDSYEPPDPPFIEVVPQAGTGYGATEAPRGLLYHRYTITSEGTITDAKIVPPTAQNQRAIETDLAAFATGILDDADLEARCEGLVRSYDPCISCATHFLDLRVSRP
jgi:sulfhydrogenase subunit alpha